MTIDDLDPFDDPAWQRTLALAGAPPTPATGYVTCSLAWLARTAPVVGTVNQLVVAMLLYRRCLLARGRTVPLSNSELEVFGISRFAKYRALAGLKAAGVVSTEAPNGRSTRVTLLGFP